MPSSGDADADPGSSSAGQFVVRLGGAMAVAGEPVNRIREHLVKVARAYEMRTVEIFVLPTALFIDTGHETTDRVYLSSEVGRAFRLDQIEALYDLVRKAERGQVDPAAGLGRLDAIDAMQPGLPWEVRAFGSGVLSAGLALLFQPTWSGLIGAALLGVLVGLLKMPDRPTLQLVFPVVASFLVAAIVLSMPDTFRQPLFIVVPPLITLLPGGVLTTGTMEMAANEMVSGAGRLAYGAVQLMLLAFGILAAAALLNVTEATLTRGSSSNIGWWAPWLGVFVTAVGYYLYFTARWRSVPWILSVMLVAYAGQRLGADIFAAQLSGFFGALAMTPLALWLDDSHRGPPTMVTFLPGFWLLVPGAGGLLGFTELVGQDQTAGAQDFVGAIITILSISLGVLIGTALYRTVRSGVQTVAATAPVQRILDATDLPRNPRRG